MFRKIFHSRKKLNKKLERSQPSQKLEKANGYGAVGLRQWLAVYLIKIKNIIMNKTKIIIVKGTTLPDNKWINHISRLK